jgi:hypothetical protein
VAVDYRLVPSAESAFTALVEYWLEKWRLRTASPASPGSCPRDAIRGDASNRAEAAAAVHARGDSMPC